MRTRASKYNNRKTTVGGHTFDSRKEATRYRQLIVLERAGVIGNLELQPAFRISNGGSVDPATGRKMSARKYIADFRYIENGQDIVEDVKSPATAKDKLYRLKRQLFLEQYGDDIRFVEV